MNPQMKNKRINFSDLSFFKMFSVTVREKYHIPIKIHIKDINFRNDIELELGLLGKEGDPFFCEFEQLRMINYYKKYLKYINVEDKLFSNYTKNFLEYNEMKSIDEILHVLDKEELAYIISKIIPIESLMVNLYRNRLFEMLKLDVDDYNKINYKPKNIKPKDLQDYLEYTRGYIMTQVFKEYNPTIFFPENIGKSVEDFSFREIELHMCYITRKTKIDNMNNTWEAHCIEENQKSNKR